MVKVDRIDTRTKPELYYTINLLGRKIPQAYYAKELKKTDGPKRGQTFIPEVIKDTRVNEDGKKEF